MSKGQLARLELGVSWWSTAPRSAAPFSHKNCIVNKTCMPAEGSERHSLARHVATRAEEGDPRVSVAYADAFSARCALCMLLLSGCSPAPCSGSVWSGLWESQDLAIKGIASFFSHFRAILLSAIGGSMADPIPFWHVSGITTAYADKGISECG